MRLGKIKIFIFIILFFIGNTTILFAIDKIESVPLINLEELSPTFEEDKDVLENKDELNDFIPYLNNGTLMSTSGLRFAGELDKVKSKLPEILPIRLISATVVNEMVRYGIHMIDAIDSLGLLSVKSIKRLNTVFDSFQLQCENDSIILLNCLKIYFDKGIQYHLSQIEFL